MRGTLEQDCKAKHLIPEIFNASHMWSQTEHQKKVTDVFTIKGNFCPAMEKGVLLREYFCLVTSVALKEILLAENPYFIHFMLWFLPIVLRWRGQRKPKSNLHFSVFYSKIPDNMRRSASAIHTPSSKLKTVVHHIHEEGRKATNLLRRKVRFLNWQHVHPPQLSVTGSIV